MLIKFGQNCPYFQLFDLLLSALHIFVCSYYIFNVLVTHSQEIILSFDILVAFAPACKSVQIIFNHELVNSLLLKVCDNLFGLEVYSTLFFKAFVIVSELRVDLSCLIWNMVLNISLPFQSNKWVCNSNICHFSKFFVELFHQFCFLLK